MSEFPNYIFRTRQFGGSRNAFVTDGIAAARKTALNADNLLDVAKKNLGDLELRIKNSVDAREIRKLNNDLILRKSILEGATEYQKRAKAAVTRAEGTVLSSTTTKVDDAAIDAQKTRMTSLLTVVDDNLKKMTQLKDDALKRGDNELSNFFEVMEQGFKDLSARLKTQVDNTFTPEDFTRMNTKFQDDLDDLANSLAKMSSKQDNATLLKIMAGQSNVGNVAVREQMVKLALQDINITDDLRRTGALAGRDTIDQAVNVARLNFLKGIKAGDQKYFNPNGTFKPAFIDDLAEISSDAAIKARNDPAFMKIHKADIQDNLKGFKKSDQAIKAKQSFLEKPNGTSLDRDLLDAKAAVAKYKDDIAFKEAHKQVDSPIVKTDLVTEMRNAQEAAVVIRALHDKGFKIEEIMYHLKNVPDGHPNKDSAKRALDFMETTLNAKNVDPRIFREMTGKDYAKNLVKSADSTAKMQWFLQKGSKRPGLWGRSPRTRRAFKVFLALGALGALIGGAYAIANMKQDPPDEVIFTAGSEEEEMDGSGAGSTNFTPEELEALRQAEECIKTGAGFSIEKYLTGEADISGVYEDMDLWECNAYSSGAYDFDNDGTTPPPTTAPNSDGILSKIQKTLEEWFGENWMIYSILIMVVILLIIGIGLYFAFRSGGTKEPPPRAAFDF